MSIAILLLLLAQQPPPNSTLEGLPTQIEAGRSIQVVFEVTPVISNERKGMKFQVRF